MTFQDAAEVCVVGLHGAMMSDSTLETRVNSGLAALAMRGCLHFEEFPYRRLEACYL